MQGTQVVWEDDENSRQVVLSVQWTRTDDQTEVCGILPQEVRILCPQSGVMLRSIGVWTKTGRDLLARQFQQTAQYADVHRDILAGITV